MSTGIILRYSIGPEAVVTRHSTEMPTIDDVEMAAAARFVRDLTCDGIRASDYGPRDPGFEIDAGKKVPARDWPNRPRRNPARLAIRCCRRGIDFRPVIDRKK